MVNNVNVRLVGERDTQWESHRQDYRVFAVHDEFGWEVYDIDSQTLAAVREWAIAKTAERQPGAYYSIAIRIVNERGPGLLWLLPDPDDPEAAYRDPYIPPGDPSVAVATGECSTPGRPHFELGPEGFRA